MGKLSLFLGCLFVSSNLWAAKIWNPKIEFSNRSIHFAPAKAHMVAGQARVEIVESEGCEAKVQSANLVQFSESCDFIRGIYTYPVKVQGQEQKATVFSEFMLRQLGPKSYFRLVNSPTVIFEG